MGETPDASCSPRPAVGWTGHGTVGGSLMGAYEESYRRSLADPDGFWLEAATAIDWTRPPTRGLDDSAAPLYRWVPDGELNTSYNALDRHVEAGDGERTALIYDSPVTGTVRRYTYAELRDEAAKLAADL